MSGDPVRDPRLWNADLAPTTAAERSWGTYDIAALWFGLSVAITAYTLASGLMAEGMSWWQALCTILLGNVIVLVPLLLNAHAGTRHGVSFPVLCRASFGVYGAHVPAMLRALVACGWFGIQTWIGALALDTLLTALWSGWGAIGAHAALAFAAFWLLQVAIILRGTEGIRRLETYAAPLLLAGGLALLTWAVRTSGGLDGLLAASPALPRGTRSFWAIFPAALTANVGYWATLSLNIPDFSRFAKDQRAQLLGQTLGLPLAMTAVACIGVAVTTATILRFGEPIWDPVVLVTRIGGPVIVAAAAVVVVLAQLTTNMAANVVAPSNDFANLSPRHISYVTGGLLTAVLGIAMMPWRLYADAAAYIFTWLLGYSSLMGAIGGIMIADYWILRRQRLDVEGLFRADGPYRYWRGVNPRALVALAASVLPVVPGFVRAATTPGGLVATPGPLDTLYTYAWFVTFALSTILYLGLMRGTGRSAGRLPERS